jgi:CRP-like cAMP-binding protein
MALKSPLLIWFSRSPLCEGLSEEEVSQVFDLFEVQEVAANTALYTQGELADALYVVLEGRVEIARGEVRLGEVLPGATIGEMSLFRKSPIRSATAQTATTVTVLRIGRERFREALIARDIPAMLVANLTEQIADRLNAPPPTR